MEHLEYIPFASFLFCAAIVVAIVIRRRWNPTSLSLLAAMVSLALMELAASMALKVSEPEIELLWSRIGLTGEVFFGGNWLLFSLIFGRDPHLTTIKKWRWGVPMVYVLPGIALGILFSMNQGMVMKNQWIIALSPFAKCFHILMLGVFVAET